MLFYCIPPKHFSLSPSILFVDCGQSNWDTMSMKWEPRRSLCGTSLVKRLHCNNGAGCACASSSEPLRPSQKLKINTKTRFLIRWPHIKRSHDIVDFFKFWSYKSSLSNSRHLNQANHHRQSPSLSPSSLRSSSPLTIMVSRSVTRLAELWS